MEMQLSFTDIVRPVIHQPPLQESTWTDERVELLKSLRRDGLSATEIAGKMGGFERCRDGGRSAVCGKLWRLKVPPPLRRPRPPQPRAYSIMSPEQRDRQRTAKRKYNERKRLENGRLPPLIIEEVPMPADFLNLTFDELRVFSHFEVNQCRYIRGADADMRYCGQPTPEGKPCCRFCARIAYRVAA